MNFFSTDMLLLDGATGTELERRGFQLSAPLWSARALLDAPDLVERIHAEYIAAGAAVIVTNSFRTNTRAIAAGDLTRDDARDLTRLSVRLALRAREISGRPGDVLIAGSDAPVEDCYRPDLVPSDGQLAREHAEHIGWLAAAGCDIIILETMNTLREALAASRAASQSALPFMVSLVTDDSGERLLDGEAFDRSVESLAAFNPLAILTNCASLQATLRSTGILARVRRRTDGAWRFGGYPNGGVPDPVLGYKRLHPASIPEFVACAAAMRSMGATVIGSCCQTTPEWTRALKDAIAAGWDSLRQTS